MAAVSRVKRRWNVSIFRGASLCGTLLVRSVWTHLQVDSALARGGVCVVQVCLVLFFIRGALFSRYDFFRGRQKLRSGHTPRDIRSCCGTLSI